MYEGWNNIHISNYKQTKKHLTIIYRLAKRASSSDGNHEYFFKLENTGYFVESNGYPIEKIAIIFCIHNSGCNSQNIR